MKLQTKIFLFFIIWSLWLSLEFLLGTFSHVRIHDSGDGLLPQLIASKIQFQKYGISYFAPYMASGVDASAQFLVPFSSLNSTIFMFLPGWLAYGILMFLQRFLASYFTYRLCKDILNLKTIPSIFAGILFSLLNFSSYSFTIYHQLGLPALPFILWSLEKIISFKTLKKYVILIAFGIFVGFSTYFSYFTPFLFIFTFIWFFAIRKISNKQIITELAIFFGCILMVQLESILSTFTNSSVSQRSSWDLGSEAFLPRGPIINAANFIRDNFFANIISILIVVVAMLSKNNKHAYFKKLAVLSALFILLPAAFRIIQPSLVTLFGPLATFPLYRVYMFIPFVFSLAAASGLDTLNIKILKRSINIATIVVVVLLLASLKIKIETVKNYAPYRSLYLHPDLVSLSKTVQSEKWRIATVTGGGIRPSYALANGLSTVDTYITLYPESYHQYWSKVIAKRIVDDKAKYDDFVGWGNRIYLYGPEDFYSLESIEFRKYYDLDLLSQANVRYFVSQKPLSDPDLKLLPSEYQEKVANWDELSKFSKLEAFIKGKYFGPPLYVYENQKVLPRFFVLENGQISDQMVTINFYSPDNIVLSTSSSSPNTLVAAINYYPWWKATINDQAAVLTKYQDTFMSVEIPKGENTITFEYNPPYKIL